MYKKNLRTAFKAVLSFLTTIIFIYYQWRNESFPDEELDKGKYPEFKPWYFEGGSLRPQYGAGKLKLWPDEAEDDRILNQLMFIPEKEPRAPRKRIFLTKLQNLKYERGSKIFEDLKCPVRNCEVVSDQTLADAVVFEDYVTTIRNASSDQVWILHSLESPLFSGKVIQETSVNWTASYRLDSDLVTPYDKWVYYDESDRATPPVKNYAEGKTKKVAWFVSNCHSKNKRLEYANTLAKYIPVDVYGDCGDKICPKKLGEYCRDMISTDYKFYLSFENANCRDYITEKFYTNALRLDVIPIVMGPPKVDYEKVAPHNSFIHVEDFPSPKHLAEYLKYLDENDEEYNSYFSWKGSGEFINTYFMCRLCAMLHAQRTSHFYRKISHWWRRPGICTKTFWNSTNRGTILRSLRSYRRNRKVKNTAFVR